MAFTPPLARARWVAFLWGVFLLILTSWPRPPQAAILSAIPNFDKLIHSALYAVEAFWMYRAVRWPGRAGFSLARAFAITGVLAVWGAADELHQAWIPGRSMEGEDVAADVAGAIAGALIASALAGQRPQLSAVGSQLPAKPARPSSAGG